MNETLVIGRPRPQPSQPATPAATPTYSVRRDVAKQWSRDVSQLLAWVCTAAITKAVPLVAMVPAASTRLQQAIGQTFSEALGRGIDAMTDRQIEALGEGAGNAIGFLLGVPDYQRPEATEEQVAAFQVLFREFLSPP